MLETDKEKEKGTLCILKTEIIVGTSIKTHVERSYSVEKMTDIYHIRDITLAKYGACYRLTCKIIGQKAKTQMDVKKSTHIVWDAESFVLETPQGRKVKRVYLKDYPQAFAKLAMNGGELYAFAGSKKILVKRLNKSAIYFEEYYLLTVQVVMDGRVRTTKIKSYVLPQLKTEYDARLELYERLEASFCLTLEKRSYGHMPEIINKSHSAHKRWLEV